MSDDDNSFPKFGVFQMVAYGCCPDRKPLILPKPHDPPKQPDPPDSHEDRKKRKVMVRIQKRLEERNRSKTDDVNGVVGEKPGDVGREVVEERGGPRDEGAGGGHHDEGDRQKHESGGGGVA